MRERILLMYVGLFACLFSAVLNIRSIMLLQADFFDVIFFSLDLVFIYAFTYIMKAVR